MPHYIAFKIFSALISGPLTSWTQIFQIYDFLGKILIYACDAQQCPHRHIAQWKVSNFLYNDTSSQHHHAVSLAWGFFSTHSSYI